MEVKQYRAEWTFVTGMIHSDYQARDERCQCSLAVNIATVFDSFRGGIKFIKDGVASICGQCSLDLLIQCFYDVIGIRGFVSIERCVRRILRKEFSDSSLPVVHHVRSELGQRVLYGEQGELDRCMSVAGKLRYDATCLRMTSLEAYPR